MYLIKVLTNETSNVCGHCIVPEQWKTSPPGTLGDFSHYGSTLKIIWHNLLLVIVEDDGKVFCWGWNKYGQVRFFRSTFNLFHYSSLTLIYWNLFNCTTQLGLGDVIDRSIPIQVPIDGSLPKNVTCGWWHTLVLAELPTWAIVYCRRAAVCATVLSGF